MEKHSFETWQALADVDPVGTFNKLVQFLQLEFTTAQNILTSHDNDHRSASKYLLVKFRDTIIKDGGKESAQDKSPATSPSQLPQNYLERPLGDFTYLVIGFLFANLVPILAYIFLFAIPIDNVSTLYIFVSFLLLFAILYFSTVGRYGRVSFYGILNISVWAFIPIINWGVAYYLGKGLHIKLSKQELYNPHKPTPVGLIIIAILVLLAWVGNSSFPNLSPVTTPTNFPRPKATSSPRSSGPVVSAPTRMPCYRWEDVSSSMNGRIICVYGTVLDYRENWNDGQSMFYFGSKDQFFFVSLYRWEESPEGKCVQSSGEVQLNTYKVPYIKIDQFSFCNP